MCLEPTECPCSGMQSGGEWLVILALIASEPYMLSRAELQRELVRRPGEESPNLDDAIGNLHAVGLINVCGELVGASRAARYMDELLGGSV
jgi:hypothetical protein